VRGLRTVADLAVLRTLPSGVTRLTLVIDTVPPVTERDPPERAARLGAIDNLHHVGSRVAASAAAQRGGLRELFVELRAEPSSVHYRITDFAVAGLHSLSIRVFPSTVFSGSIRGAHSYILPDKGPRGALVMPELQHFCIRNWVMPTDVGKRVQAFLRAHAGSLRTIDVSTRQYAHLLQSIPSDELGSVTDVLYPRASRSTT
jgi:hypothetical protein